MENTSRDMLGGIANGSVQGSGGFAFDEQTMRDLVRDWYALADHYAASRLTSHRMAMVVGPGLDHASASQARATNAHGAAYLSYLRHNEKYCLEQARVFEDALNDYLVAEGRNVVDIRAADRRALPGPPTGI
jgi:hypothetical protein